VKLTSLLSPAAAVVMITAAVLAATTGVQATQDQPQVSAPAAQSAPPPPAGAPAQGGHPMHNFPAPTNLQVLPKNLTGQQLHEIMESFAGSLGVHCDFCHAADPIKKMPNGQPQLNFADDSKNNKKIARIMYTMVQQINGDYISKSTAIDPDAMGMKVTCGTCHRGHDMPEEFVIPKQGEPPQPAGTTPAGSERPATGIPPSSN
jgi:hypothetical protein